jgi:hypothetical protein
LNHNGSFAQLTAFESNGIAILWHSFLNTPTNKYEVETFAFSMNSGERVNNGLIPLSLDIDGLAFDVAHNQNVAFLVYVSLSQLNIREYRPTNIGSHVWADVRSGDFFNVFSSHADAFGNVFIVVLAAGNPYKFQCFKYSQAARNFLGPYPVRTLPGQTDAFDVSLTQDGFGNLLAIWSEHVTGEGLDVRYAISKDQGVSWSESIVIPREQGHSVFVDSPTAQRAGRSTAIAGNRGFIVSYASTTGGGVDRTYVRTISTKDGTEYVLGPAKEIGAQAGAQENVTGLRFFHPPQPKLIDIDDPGSVRIAYSIGQGNSRVQNDTVPIRIGQELLSESAFVESSGDKYAVDKTGDDEILVKINILSGPSERDDYFALGLVGHATRKYLAAFRKVGIEMNVLRYEPLPHSEMNDRSAYSTPSASTARLVMEPKTYEQPLGNSGEPTQTQFMERDIRAVYFPPDEYMARNNLVNRGGYLKRTVWTLEFDGNEYELTQVVPYFVDGAIAYYKANAYVIGPGRNPWSRPILSSET